MLEAWGEDALPALPDLLPLLADSWTALHVVRVLQAIGTAAAPAAPALRTCQVLDYPGNHSFVASTAAYITMDREARLRMIGDAVTATEEPDYRQIGALAEFGSDAAPHAHRVRLAMENSTDYSRLSAAITLWSITGRTEPSIHVLEEFVVPVATGGDSYGFFRDTLQALVRMGEITPAIRAALLTIHQLDRRLSTEGGYPAILRDDELRGLIELALACGDTDSRETC
ncbi:hypothetical protein EDD39_7548 [Kitasatospora cineracea]|uniref:Uncharacterized protein n=1 Tax=Kitasatospora cineracea TaxID=88074 RepID=A0A8G1UAJ0_9ACTN|nr:hypothetical protein EDD39_7548 [Kitasatospora cineracea]